MTLRDQYRLAMVPVIKAAIIEMANEPDDMKVQRHITSKFRGYHASNLIAYRVGRRSNEVATTLVQAS